MDIRRSFEILELSPGADMDEARQAYKDLVNIWHPDRFSQNPRLKNKAEKKLKEINAAYEAVEAYLVSPRPRIEATDRETRDQARYESRGSQRTRDPDTAEVIAETGTRLVLTAWTYVSQAFRRLVSEATREEPTGSDESSKGPGGYQRQESPGERGRERDAGPGRGKGGMGRGRGRGMGRGGGRGRGR